MWFASSDATIWSICACMHVMCINNTQNKYLFCMLFLFNSFFSSLLSVTWNMHYNSKNIRNYLQYVSVPKLHWNMSSASNTFSCSVEFVLFCGVCFILKRTTFPLHVSVSQFYRLSILLSSGRTFIELHQVTPSDYSSKPY